MEHMQNNRAGGLENTAGDCEKEKGSVNREGGNIKTIMSSKTCKTYLHPKILQLQYNYTHTHTLYAAFKVILKNFIGCFAQMFV